MTSTSVTLTPPQKFSTLGIGIPAVSEPNTLLNIPMPFRVNAYGSVLIFDKFFVVANCDRKNASSIFSYCYVVTFSERFSLYLVFIILSH